MKAIVQDRYGSPDVLRLSDVEPPTYGDDGVLVRVRAASINAKDWHLMRGRPYLARVASGLARPREAIPGTDLAGTVEAVGRDVSELHPGDAVFGARSGAYAEYVAGRVDHFVLKPDRLSFEQAAAIPVAAITALQALRDHGHVQPGQHVLIIGAGGGVGTFAVQLAKGFGAVVTAATSTANLDLVRSIGADEVVDYSRTDITRSGRRFDVVIDVGGYLSLGDLARVAAPKGAVVPIGAGKATTLGIVSGIVVGQVRQRVLGQRNEFFVAKITRDDLLVLAQLAIDGTIEPVIDRSYPLAQIADAMRYAETGKARGKIVTTI
jgi:NADPH:quinone reductase-like Zn-dependent oxidoreductase